MANDDSKNFAQLENSDYQGSPIELYKFTFGDKEDSVYRYCNGIAALQRDPTKPSSESNPYVGSDNDPIWLPTPINREAIQQSSKAERTSLIIHVPVDTDLAQMYGDYPPATVCTCTIYAGHLTDPYMQFRTIWQGRILSVTKHEDVTDLTCDSLLASFARPGLRRNFQYPCPLILYSQYCRANKRAFRAEVIEVINGRTMTVKGGWNEDVDFTKFTNGIITWQGDNGLESRTLGTVNEKQLAIRGSLRYLKAGTICNIYLGCNHQLDDCEHLHNNVQNYGGQPWIPLKNPCKYHDYW